MSSLNEFASASVLKRDLRRFTRPWFRPVSRSDCATALPKFVSGEAKDCLGVSYPNFLNLQAWYSSAEQQYVV